MIFSRYFDFFDVACIDKFMIFICSLILRFVQVSFVKEQEETQENDCSESFTVLASLTPATYSQF